MKIVIINTLYYPNRLGGAEVSVQILAESLVKSSVEVAVITLHDNSEIKVENINGVKVYYLPLMNEYWPYNDVRRTPLQKLKWHLKDIYNHRMIKLVENIICELNPDLVHTNNLSGFSVGVWGKIKKMNIPVVHTTRDYYLLHPNSTLYRRGSNMPLSNVVVRMNKLYKRYMSNNVSCFIGISKYISDFHRQLGFCKKGFHDYIYNPVEKPTYFCKETDSEVKTIGFIGRLTPDKGFDNFIEIANSFSSKFIFMAAGKTDASNESKVLLEKAKNANIEILGYIPVEVFFEKVDAILLPTKWNEPFGRVVAESALAYKPVYTNFVGGISEISSYFPWVRNIDIFSQEDLEQTIDVIKLENASREDNPFDKNNHVERYTSIYNRVIGEGE